MPLVAAVGRRHSPLRPPASPAHAAASSTARDRRKNAARFMLICRKKRPINSGARWEASSPTRDGRDGKLAGLDSNEQERVRENAG